MVATAAEKLRDKLTKLFAMLGSNIADEREVACCKIDDLLAKNKKNWNDLSRGKTSSPLGAVLDAIAGRGRP